MHLWLSRCAASSAASCRGNSCRVSGAGMIVTMFRWFATLLRSWGLLRVLFCMLARGFLVTSDGSFYFGPESASLGPFVDEVPCLYTQDPVAQRLTRRCVLHSQCLFRFCLVPDLAVSPILFPWSFQRILTISRILVWLRAKHTCTCDGFS